MGLPATGPSYLNGPQSAYATAHPGVFPPQTLGILNPLPSISRKLCRGRKVNPTVFGATWIFNQLGGSSGDLTLKKWSHKNPTTFATLQWWLTFTNPKRSRYLNIKNRPNEYWPLNLWTYLSLDDRFHTRPYVLLAFLGWFELHLASSKSSLLRCCTSSGNSSWVGFLLVGMGWQGGEWLNIKTCWITLR